MASQSEHRPIHFYVEGGCYFISAAILRHQPLMAQPSRREWFLDCLSRTVAETSGELVAWVILPNHYHAVVRVQHAQSISHLMNLLHGRSARQFNLEDDTPDR